MKLLLIHSKKIIPHLTEKAQGCNGRTDSIINVEEVKQQSEIWIVANRVLNIEFFEGFQNLVQLAVAWLQDPQEIVNISNDVDTKDDDGDLQNNVVELMRMARAHIQVVLYLTGNKLIIFKQFLRIDENQEH